ncbi:MAG: phytanoyl-CoA dioxygenase family protein [Chloroflexi bacterium]|nr:phytanoyl-CoA dioxygenase family protein [Chloroflexota bacterium]
MNEIEKYEFDRLGYIVIPGFLTSQEIERLASAVDAAEEDALAQADRPPDKISAYGLRYRHNAENGYFVSGAREEGNTLVIEEFFNIDPAFDILVGHGKTMAYISEIVKERPTINNSEIRIRYPGNQTGSHMGGPVSWKHQYAYSGRGIDCMMVRMVYFVHDVGAGQGEFCVVPATHKSNLASPYEGRDPDKEPGMIGLPAKAGDAILFTENLRHGGLTNRSRQTRKTLHVGYGPYWMKSQNHSTMDEEPYILPRTFARYTNEQRLLFRSHQTLLAGSVNDD